MVQIIKHGESRSGRFLVEGTIGDMRFIGEQNGKKMELRFYPYDHSFQPDFSEREIYTLQKSIKQAWMIIKQPKVFVQHSGNDAWLVEDQKKKEPASRRQAKVADSD